MIREEAIKIIEVVFKSKEAYKHNDSVTHQALNMAIEALQAEPTLCKECIHMKTECCDEGTCFYWCKHWENATDDWGTCYYGERREP